MSTPITNAASILLDEITGTLPNMSGTLVNYFQNLEFNVITKTVVNFKLIETKTTVAFRGVVEAITGQQLMIKPEGQRNWTWINVWALPNLVLKPDDIFEYKGVRYRVMKRNDWRAYGYVQYDCCEQYEGDT